MSTYLTGASNQYVRAIAIDEGIGILLRPGNSYHLHVDDFACWAADNGQYTTKPGSAPSDSEWLEWLQTATAEPRPQHLPLRHCPRRPHRDRHRRQARRRR